MKPDTLNDHADQSAVLDTSDRSIEYVAKGFDGSGEQGATNRSVHVADYYIDPVRKVVVFCLSVEYGKPETNL